MLRNFYPLDSSFLGAMRNAFFLLMGHKMCPVKCWLRYHAVLCSWDYIILQYFEFDVSGYPRLHVSVHPLGLFFQISESQQVLELLCFQCLAAPRLTQVMTAVLSGQSCIVATHCLLLTGWSRIQEGRQSYCSVSQLQILSRFLLHYLLRCFLCVSHSSMPTHK